MLQGNAGQNQVISGRRTQNAVFYHKDVAVGTFRNPFPSVEDCFLAACFRAALISDYAGNQVQGLDVAVEEPGVLHGYQLKGTVHGNQFAGNGKNHQVGSNIRRREIMGPQRRTAGTLPVKHAVIDFIGVDAFL